MRYIGKADGDVIIGGIFRGLVWVNESTARVAACRLLCRPRCGVLLYITKLLVVDRIVAGFTGFSWAHRQLFDWGVWRLSVCLFAPLCCRLNSSIPPARSAWFSTASDVPEADVT